MDIIGAVTGVLALIIALLTYYKTYHQKPNFDDERTNMLGMFRANQFIQLELQELMQKYIDDNDGADHEITPGVTFQKYLDAFKIECDKGLSEELFEDLKNNPIYTKSNIETFLKGLENQNATFTSLKGYLMLKK